MATNPQEPPSQFEVIDEEWKQFAHHGRAWPTFTFVSMIIGAIMFIVGLVATVLR